MKLNVMFRINDIDEDKSNELYTFSAMIDYISEWNTDMGTKYHTIQEFNDGEEYYEIEAVVFTTDYLLLN